MRQQTNNQDLIDELCATLKTKYIISEPDNLESFLGVQWLKRMTTGISPNPGI
jgi:hypothetical protein